jgi:hypothetical protein
VQTAQGVERIGQRHDVEHSRTRAGKNSRLVEEKTIAMRRTTSDSLQATALKLADTLENQIVHVHHGNIRCIRTKTPT